MNGFIVVEQLEIELPEPYNESGDKDEKKDSFEREKLSDFIKKMSGLLHAAPSTLENNLNADIFWHLNAHQLAECTFVSVDIDKALVNPQLPAVPRCGSLPIGALTDWHDQSFGRKRYWTGQINTCALCDLPYPVTDHLYFFKVRSCQANSGFLHVFFTSKKLF